MATDKRDPDPARTAGLEAGGGVQPGETPPNADQLSGAAGDRQKTPNKGPAIGNRTPMIITLVLIGLIVLSVLVYGIAEISSYLSDDPVSGETGTNQRGAESLGLLR
ncbi:MAG: DUF6480 family protein [Actinomycetota bacterium]|nr:DUF6480 family protein [Actinomycetota bacterium]MDP9461448.1 DUF6480 family protein [Actinomycetota bacterium]